MIFKITTLEDWALSLGITTLGLAVGVISVYSGLLKNPGEELLIAVVAVLSVLNFGLLGVRLIRGLISIKIRRTA